MPFFTEANKQIFLIALHNCRYRTWSGLNNTHTHTHVHTHTITLAIPEEEILEEKQN